MFKKLKLCLHTPKCGKVTSNSLEPSIELIDSFVG